MKYYLIHNQYLSDGQTIIGATQEFDSIDKAKSAYHSAMASDMVSEAVLGSLVKIFSTNGKYDFTDYYQKSFDSTVEAEESVVSE